MTKPLSTMMRTNDLACGARHLAQCFGSAGRMLANAFPDQTPCGFEYSDFIRAEAGAGRKGQAIFVDYTGEAATRKGLVLTDAAVFSKRLRPVRQEDLRRRPIFSRQHACGSRFAMRRCCDWRRIMARQA